MVYRSTARHLGTFIEAVANLSTSPLDPSTAIPSKIAMPDDLRRTNSICNKGDIFLLHAIDLSLNGCEGPSLLVTELVAGSGARYCPHLNNELCTEEQFIIEKFPIVHGQNTAHIGSNYYNENPIEALDDCDEDKKLATIDMSQSNSAAGFDDNIDSLDDIDDCDNDLSNYPHL
eukprot:3808169-Ditylum_brightwellii.AAC.1